MILVRQASPTRTNQQASKLLRAHQTLKRSLFIDISRHFPRSSWSSTGTANAHRKYLNVTRQLPVRVEATDPSVDGMAGCWVVGLNKSTIPPKQREARRSRREEGRVRLLDEPKAQSMGPAHFPPLSS